MRIGTLVVVSLAWLMASQPQLLAEGREISRAFRGVLLPPGEIADEITCTACSVDVRGEVLGDVVTFGGDVAVEGKVKGDVIVVGGSIRLLGNSVVEGDALAIGGYVESFAGSKPDGDSDSFPFIHLPGQRSFHGVGVTTFVAINIVFVLGTALVIRRRRVRNLSASLRSHPWQTLALGSGALLVWQLLVIFSGKSHRWVALLVSLETLLMGATFLPGYAGASAFVGERILGSRGWVRFLVTGALAISLVQMIPVGGFFAMLILLAFGIGCAVLSGLGSDPVWLHACFRPGAK